MTLNPGYTFWCDPPYYTGVPSVAASLPSDWCIPNFDLRGDEEPAYTRSRYNIFTDDESVVLHLFGGPWAGSTYEVRDYFGTIVAAGSADVADLDLGPLPPGWYRLYLRRADPIAMWGRAQGGACFVVWRADNEGRFHRNKVIGDPTNGNSEGGSDITLRSVMLLGPQRLQIFCPADPTLGDGGVSGVGTLAGVLADIAIEQEWYTPYDTGRAKPLLVNFANYDNAIVLKNNATGGTWTLSLGGYTTTPIAYNASPNDIKTALLLLPSVGAFKGYAIIGPLNNPTTTAGVTVGLLGAVCGLQAPSITVDDSGLIGGSMTVQVENDGVTAAVLATKDYVSHYEGRNEPDGQGAAVWLPKQRAFYETVKAAAPGAKVIGPCPTSLAGPASSGVYHFLRKFLDICAGDFPFDELSYHDYNNIWGDLTLGRQVYDRLQSLLDSHGIGDMLKWMTECGAGATDFGVYQPQLQGRFVMLSLQIHEQYGVPKERENYFYDRSGGFWNVPTFYAESEITFHPATSLFRVWAEEIYDKNFVQRYGFGAVAEPHTIGSRFEGPDGSSVAVFSSAGRPDDVLDCIVSDGVTSLTACSPFGVLSELSVVDRHILVPLYHGIPTYVRLPVGVTLRPVAKQHGPNLALGATYTPAGSGAGASKVTDGVLRNWYFEQQGDIRHGESACFTDDDDVFPQAHVLDFGAPTTVDTMVIRCPPVYYFAGTLIDFDYGYWNGSAWVTLGTVTKDAASLFEPSEQIVTGCQVDSFFGDQSVFVLEFPTVTTTKLRLWVRDATYGGFPDLQSHQARGENHPHVVQLRQWEAYHRSGLPAPKYGARVA